MAVIKKSVLLSMLAVFSMQNIEASDKKDEFVPDYRSGWRQNNGARGKKILEQPYKPSPVFEPSGGKLICTKLLNVEHQELDPVGGKRQKRTAPLLVPPSHRGSGVQRVPAPALFEPEIGTLRTGRKLVRESSEERPRSSSKRHYAESTQSSRARSVEPSARHLSEPLGGGEPVLVKQTQLVGVLALQLRDLALNVHATRVVHPGEIEAMKSAVRSFVTGEED